MKKLALVILAGVLSAGSLIQAKSIKFDFDDNKIAKWTAKILHEGEKIAKHCEDKAAKLLENCKEESKELEKKVSDELKKIKEQKSKK